MSTANPTPMIRQYRELKAQHPGALLFFRLGDFYELFFDDAIIGARELQITLTARHKDSKDPVPMCGVPHHSAANYIAKLVRKGYRVAICEQTEDVSKAKKLVRRDVVRIVTPGTPIDPQLLEARETVSLAAVCARGEPCGAAFLDLPTGECGAAGFSSGAHRCEVNRLPSFEQLRIDWRTGRDDPHDIAPHQLLSFRNVFCLFANGDAIPLPYQFRYVVRGRVMRDPAHWNRIFAVFVSSRESNLKLARANDRVIKEQFIEVAQAKEKQRS